MTKMIEPQQPSTPRALGKVIQQRNRGVKGLLMDGSIENWSCKF